MKQGSETRITGRAHSYICVTGAALTFGVALLGSPAAAEPNDRRAGAALQWVRLPGTEDCLSGDLLARKVEAKLQREVFPAPSKASILIEGHVERVPEGYRAELRMSASDGKPLGSRELTSPQSSCAELSETVAVVLAVMIDPDATTRVEPPQEEPKPAPEPKPEPQATLADRQRLLGFARLAVGILPGSALGIGVAYEVAFERWGELRVEGVTYLEREDALPGDPNLKARLRIAHAGVAYCPLRLQLAQLRVAGCAGGELGGAYSEGSGFDPENHSTIALWGSGSASARLAVKLVAALELHLGASFVVPAARRYQGVDTDGVTRPLFEAEPVACSFDLGLGAHF